MYFGQETKNVIRRLSYFEEKSFQLSEEASKTNNTATFKEAHALSKRARELKSDLETVNSSIKALGK